MADIAIIGAGVSGLAVAWGLRNYPGKVVLYEQSEQIGGNCQSRWVASGDDYRFCDLGVNDFNTRAYAQVVEAMDEVGIGYSLLEDSACFYTPDGSTAYTIGGLADQCPMPAELAADYARFQADATDYYQRNPDTAITIGKYLDDAVPAYSPQFGRLCIFPRVNAMYFVDPGKPARDMPFRAVMHYYILQEGFGSAWGPLRMYFHEGAQNWLKRLSQYLNRTIVTGAQQVNITAAAGSGYTVSYRKAGGETGQDRFDKVVMACHADQVAGLFANPAFVIPVQQEVLKYIRYAPSTAYAHTYTGILPPNVNLWRTYNVTIHDVGGVDPQQPHPYSMTYLCNKHQNDRRSGANDRYGGPQFLVTLNPRDDVKSILDGEIADGTRRYMLYDANTHQPIRWSLPHNILDIPAIAAQKRLPAFQGKMNLYFAGGWTYGSGLHEECWLQAQAVAQAIAGDQPFRPPEAAGEAPRHIKKALQPR